MNIEDKTKVALDRIERVFFTNDLVISGHSGGKDSVVINHLISRVPEGKWLYAKVHNVKPLLGTSGDPVAALTEMHPLTLDFLYTDVCLSNAITFLHSSNMQEWINSNYVTCQIDGSRACEYNRAGKSSKFIVNGESVCRSKMTSYVENGIFGLNMSYPIFDWSDDDVFEYIWLNDLTISKEYDVNGEYDEWWQKHNIRASR